MKHYHARKFVAARTRHKAANILRFASVSFLLFFIKPVSAEIHLRAMDDDHKLSGPFVALEGHLSAFSDIAERSVLTGAFGYSARGGLRWSGFGVFFLVEHNLWVATEYDGNVVQGAINLGLGGDIIYGRGLVRTSLALGPSILAWNTILDDAGSVGLFFEARPVGLRWAVHEILVFGLDPLNFAIVAPVLGGIPLVNVQYRTVVYLEAAF